jgi:hypothetical protein
MKILTRTITVFVVLNLITAGLTTAQPAPAPTPPEPAQVEAVEIVAKEAQEGAKALQKQMDALQLNLLRRSLPRSAAGTVLVIPTSEMKAEELVTIVEDMTVMSRIIDKQLGQEQPRHVWFTEDFMGGSSRIAETMYLQDYGALFLKKVDFPLSPGPTVPEEEQKTEKEEAVDPVWNQIKQEIYEPQEERRRRTEREEEKYDAEKVENLKTNLIKALKHAANIRELKPDDSVILTVTGSGDSSKTLGIAIPGTGQVFVQQKRAKSINVVTPTLPTGLEFSSPTVLIIRAKKSDIDSFAKGDLDLDKFRERVLTFTQ